MCGKLGAVFNPMPRGDLSKNTMGLAQQLRRIGRLSHSAASRSFAIGLAHVRTHKSQRR
ncbi:hypothetical protein DPMN_173587 [Dreissena polymorpha]|uniref:Uncharacterized protein n=1 Tax=Dreissena polymorpha TaxID=45954 RepID=A0A9D4IG84_DREPO|nr:hypothetical protein DPMN_173587 [Dreissena polymorpha]